MIISKFTVGPVEWLSEHQTVQTFYYYIHVLGCGMVVSTLYVYTVHTLHDYIHVILSVTCVMAICTSPRLPPCFDLNL